MEDNCQQAHTNVVVPVVGRRYAVAITPFIADCTAVAADGAVVLTHQHTGESVSLPPGIAQRFAVLLDIEAEAAAAPTAQARSSYVGPIASTRHARVAVPSMAADARPRPATIIGKDTPVHDGWTAISYLQPPRPPILQAPHAAVRPYLQTTDGASPAPLLCSTIGPAVVPSCVMGRIVAPFAAAVHCDGVEALGCVAAYRSEYPVPIHAATGLRSAVIKSAPELRALAAAAPANLDDLQVHLGRLDAQSAAALCSLHASTMTLTPEVITACATAPPHLTKLTVANPMRCADGAFAVGLRGILSAHVTSVTFDSLAVHDVVLRALASAPSLLDIEFSTLSGTLAVLQCRQWRNVRCRKDAHRLHAGAVFLSPPPKPRCHPELRTLDWGERSPAYLAEAVSAELTPRLTTLSVFTDADKESPAAAIAPWCACTAPIRSLCLRDVPSDDAVTDAVGIAAALQGEPLARTLSSVEIARRGGGENVRWCVVVSADGTVSVEPVTRYVPPQSDTTRPPCPVSQLILTTPPNWGREDVAL